MVSQASCYTASASDGRRYNRPYPPYLGYSHHHERRFHHPSSYDGRAVSMADQQLDMDSPQQRKRIAVACGRCRKRKIRCSGDMGGGQPCQNCKNAGNEQCLFLRVASREAPFLNEPGDFTYSVADARGLASRAPVVPVQYPQDLPGMAVASEVLTSPYRSSAAYPYVPAASKQYYPVVSSYSPQYSDEFDYSLGVSSQSVLNSEAVGMMPGHWSSRSKPHTSYAAPMYNMESSYYNTGASLVHRPAPTVSSESTSLSLSGFGADLPPAQSSRLLPDPAGRTPLPYPGVVKTPTSATSGTTLADVAAAASYISSFDTSGLSYTAGQPRDISAGYGPSSGEGLFGEQERSLQSPGSAYDMTTYTSEPRRDSLGPGHGGSTLSNGQTYVPSESMHTPHPHPDPHPGPHPHPHPHSHSHPHHAHVLPYSHPHSHSQHPHSPGMSDTGRGPQSRGQTPALQQQEQTQGQNQNHQVAAAGNHGGASGRGGTAHADSRVGVVTRR